MTSTYRGRFAPSPTGPLHFGSLIAATASYLDARSAGGHWLVRMEDVDEPRTVPGAAADILRTLEAFGLEWDGPVIFQSTRTAAYQAGLDRLKRGGWAFGCSCSRLQAGPGRYPGTCRGGTASPRAWRILTRDSGIVTFHDRAQGQYSQDVDGEAGDFVILRADGYFAYQLAVVVDDAAQGITDVVRGADLLDSTPRQIWLQRCLGYPTPRYLHTPVALNEAGQKFSKQTLAPRADATPATLRAVLRFLRQPDPPPEIDRLPDLWNSAISNWK